MNCTIHPKYEIKREPTADCEQCKILWRGKIVTEASALVEWLGWKFPDYEWKMTVGKRYVRITHGLRLPGGNVTGKSAYAFVALDSFENKQLGKVRSGAILKPASWSAPAKHERAHVLERDGWDKALGQYGVAYRR